MTDPRKPRRRRANKHGAEVEACMKANGYANMKEMAEAHGLTQGALDWRLGDPTWTLREALGLDPRKPRRRTHANKHGAEVEAFMKANGYANMKEMAEAHGLTQGALDRRLGDPTWTLREALGLDPRKPRRRRANKHGAEVEAYMKANGYASMEEMAEAHGLTKDALDWRLGDPTWTLREALDPRAAGYLVKGAFYTTLPAACAVAGIKPGAVRARAKADGIRLPAAFAREARKQARALEREKLATLDAVSPMAPPIVFGWKFPDWATACAYWGGSWAAASLRVEVNRYGRKDVPRLDGIFFEVWKVARINGRVDVKRRIRTDVPLPAGVVEVDPEYDLPMPLARDGFRRPSEETSAKPVD